MSEKQAKPPAATGIEGLDYVLGGGLPRDRVYLIQGDPALTGYGQADDRRKAVEAGFDHHLTKTPEFGELERVLAAE